MHNSKRKKIPLQNILFLRNVKHLTCLFLFPSFKSFVQFLSSRDSLIIIFYFALCQIFLHEDLKTIIILPNSMIAIFSG